MRTLAELFLQIAEDGREDQLLHKVAGKFKAISSGALVEDIRRLAKALQDLSVEPGDRVGLMADNGPHWPAVDFAILINGAVTVPIYPTLLPDQACYIGQDSGAKVVFVQTGEQLAGFLEHGGEMSDLGKLVLIEGEPPAGSEPDRVATLGELIAAGEGYDGEAQDEKARSIKPKDLASFVYTSGTTGKPKGVMLTHGNFCTNIVTGSSALDIKSEYVGLSFLPLSHVFERTIDYCYFYRGCAIAYAESVQKVGANLQEVNPHMFVSVPRVYEKFLAKVHEGVASASPLKQKIFNWAVGVAREALPYRLRLDHPPGLLGLKLSIADGLVFSKIRERLGSRFVFAFSGGAPLARDVAEFFWGAGIPIYEGYGLTETSPVITSNTPGHVKLGTVGRPIPDVEVKIAEDGEILARGPNIMRGYFNSPDATAEVLDADGWFHTGDIGEIDDDGFLRITDRKKELIVNAYGKNIAPAPIENMLKSSRFIGQAVVIGDTRKFLSALIVPDFETLAPWVQKQGITAADNAALIADDAVREMIAGEVSRVNESLAHYEEIQSWDLLPDEFTLETGELTPTQKVKRRVINEKYGAVIEGIYQRAAAAKKGP